MHWVLSAASYFGQFCVRALSADRSSAKHVSLSRPAETAPRAAASQLGVTFSFGGLSARAMAAGSPNISTTTAILLAQADMISSSAAACGAPTLPPFAGSAGGVWPER